ncbi:MAG: membrane dipeptidase, partial [Chloroflexi bacterium]|nr:membrane dipeptidase [Chloroflexota bacterium]
MSLHHRIFVFDAHCDTLGDAVESLYRPRDLTQWGERGFLDLPRMTAGGINCQIFACFPGVTRLQHGATAAALARVEAFYNLLARAPDRISLVRTARDLAQLSPNGPIGGILGLEGAEALEGSLRRLETFFRLGVRNLGLAWNARNAACDGVGVGSACGLTPFGRDVVARCRELGVMIDVSHLNAAGLEDVLEMSEGPVI